MSKVDLLALTSLLEELESGELKSVAARWLSEGGPMHGMEEADALLAVEAARRMGKADRLLEAKASTDKGIRKAASKAIHSLKTSGVEVVEEEVKEEVVEEKPVKTAKKGKSKLPDPEDETLSVEDFVRAAYLAVLGREADASGLRSYTFALELHKTMSRQDVLDSLQSSLEAQGL